MQIYNTKKDEYGLVIGSHDYLSDMGFSRSGTQLGLLVEMKLWNFIARIVNFLSGKGFKEKEYNIKYRKSVQKKGGKWNYYVLNAISKGISPEDAWANLTNKESNFNGLSMIEINLLTN